MPATAQQTISFAQARNHKLPFGPHRDRTLDSTAETDNGLRYLDNLRAKLEAQSRIYGDAARTLEALKAYLDDSTIAKELADIIGNAKDRFEQR